MQASPSSSPCALPTLFTPAVHSSSSRSRRWPSSSRGSHVNKAPAPPSPFHPVPRRHNRQHHHLHLQSGDRPPCQHPPLIHYTKKYITLASTAPHDNLHTMAIHLAARHCIKITPPHFPQPQTDALFNVTDAHTENTRNQIYIAVSEAAAASPRHVGNTR